MLEVELVQRDGTTEIARHRVRGKKFLVGRHSMCHLKLDDESLSKTHCVVIKHRYQVLITDLGSRAGTTVNGTTLCLAETAPLQHDDVICLGDSEFVLSVRDASTGEPAYCDAQYLKALPYPFIELSGRRGSQQEPATLPAAKTETPSLKDIEVHSETPDELDAPGISLTCTEETLRDLQTVHELDSDPIDEAQTTPVKAESPKQNGSAESKEKEAEQERQQRLQAVRLKILAEQGSSTAAADALQRMFPGRNG